MPSISKIHGILELLRKHYQTGLTNKEISNALNIPLSTCYRILALLKKYEYVQQKPNNQHYYLGYVHLRFAQALLDGLDESAVIDPYLEELHQLTGRTTMFARFSGRHCVAMDVRGSVDTRISVGIGEILPLSSSSSGKAVLAFLPEAAREKLISKLTFEKHTSDTIMDAEQLRSTLDTIREEGVSFNLGELHQGINSMATPVFDRNNKAFGAIAIVGTSQDLTLAVMRKLAPLSHTVGKKITEALGGEYQIDFSEPDPDKS